MLHCMIPSNGQNDNRLEPEFMHVGDCNSEVSLGSAADIYECQSMCIAKYGRSCVYFTIVANGSGACWWEPSCSSHVTSPSYKGYKVNPSAYITEIQPEFMHVGDCNSGSEVSLGAVADIYECQSRCVAKYGRSCVYFTTHAGGSGSCWWEPSCSSHNGSPSYKGYKVNPSAYITLNPTRSPSDHPTVKPTASTESPTLYPTKIATAMPTANNICTYPECESNLALDIGFLMDESESIDRKEWQIMVDFVVRLVTWDINDISYVTLIEYGYPEDFSQFLRFTQSTQSNKASIIDALQNNQYSTSGLTYTRDAIERTLEIFKQWNIETDPNAERPDLLFLLTDGRPSDSVCDDLSNMVSNSGVEIVLIGIGGGLNPLTWTNELKCLYNNKVENAFYVSQFKAREFNRIEGDLREKTCKNIVGNAAKSSIEYIDRSPSSSSYILALRSELYSLQNENHLLYIVSFSSFMFAALTSIIAIYLCCSSRQNRMVPAMHFYGKTPANDEQEF